MAILPKVNSSCLSKRLFSQKKAFNFSFGGERRGLFEDWVEEERRHEARGNPSDPKPCPACFFFLSFYYFSLHLPHYFWLALWCRAALYSPRQLLWTLSHQVNCQAVSLWSHGSEPSSLTASKCLTCGDLPPLGWIKRRGSLYRLMHTAGIKAEILSHFSEKSGPKRRAGETTARPCGQLSGRTRGGSARV